MEIDYSIIKSLKNIYIFSPAAGSLTLFLILFLDFHYKLTKREVLLRKILLIYYITFSSFWIVTWLVNYFGPIIWYIIPLGALSLQLQQVMFYHYTVVLISTKENYRIALYHYYIPILLFVVVSFFYYRIIPRFNSVNDVNNFIRPYIRISYLVYSVYYTFLIVVNYISFKYVLYKRYDKKSGAKYISWLGWVIVLRGIFVASVIFFAILQLEPPMISYILISIWHFVLVYNMLQKNYIFLYEKASKKILIPSGEIIQSKNNNPISKDYDIINQAEFEEYFKANKPYLNPYLKITDISIIFNTNRTYLSKFINNVYAVNFKSYINQWRLTEVEHLFLLKENKDKSIETLSQQAGFGSARSYWRIKKQMEKNNKLWN